MVQKKKRKLKVFVSLISDKPLDMQEFSRISSRLSEYGKPHNFKFVVFNSSPGRQLKLKHLKELSDQVYEINVDEFKSLYHDLPLTYFFRDKNESHENYLFTLIKFLFNGLSSTYNYLKEFIGGKIWKRICQDQHLNRKKQN